MKTFAHDHIWLWKGLCSKNMKNKLEDCKEGKDIISEIISLYSSSQLKEPEARPYTGAREEGRMHYADV